MKPQSVRLYDVFIIGPLMFWGGMQLRKKYPVRGKTLAWLGVSTSLYNGRNWWLKQRRLQKKS